MELSSVHRAERKRMDCESAELAAAREALRQRLERVSAAAQRCANLVYGSRQVGSFAAWERRFTFQWRYHARSQPDVLARLRSTRGDVWLAIGRDHGFCPDAALDCGDLTGEARLLAWTVRYEPLIEHLRNLLGLALEPVALVPNSDVALGPAHCPLAFLVRDAEGAVCLSGWAGLPPDLIGPQLAPPAPAPPPSAGIEGIPLAFRVIVAELEVRPAGLRTLESGDVISLGKSERIHAGAHMRFDSTDGSMRIAVRLGAAAARVEGIESGIRRHTDSFHDPKQGPSMPPQAENSNASRADVDGLPVTLSFEAGEIVLTVGELRALAPGAMLSFGRKLTDSPITVRANGRVLGTGELVVIDDFLGVRIVELHDHGAE